MTSLLNIDGKQVEIDYPSLLQNLGVDEIIRVPKKDYPEDSNPGDILTHFNLRIPQDRSGRQVVISRIIKNGCCKSPEEEKKPILSLENVWKAQVVGFLQKCSCSALLEQELFVNCIGDARDIRSLEKMLIERYKLSYPFLSNKEILEYGISVTRLKLIEKVSYVPA